jgi:hypothetical protein
VDADCRWFEIEVWLKHGSPFTSRLRASAR